LYGSKQPSADHDGRQSIKGKDKYVKAGISSTMKEIQEFNFINAAALAPLR
jgi:hypothetical protein